MTTGSSAPLGRASVPPPTVSAPLGGPSARPPVGEPPGDKETTATARVDPSRQGPPQLPRGRQSSPPPASVESVATTLRGLGKGDARGGSLDQEIDASLDRLELDGPASAGPTKNSALPLEETAATRRRESPLTGTKTTSQHPKHPGFSVSRDEVTASGHALAHALGDSSPRTTLSSTTTETSMRATDPGLDERDSPTAGPMTLPQGRGGIDESLGPPQAHPETKDLTRDDETGAAEMKVDLETTHSGSDDEIVIAEDLAELVDPSTAMDSDERTDAGAGFPPHRGNH